MPRCVISLLGHFMNLFTCVFTGMTKRSMILESFLNSSNIYKVAPRNDAQRGSFTPFSTEFYQILYLKSRD
jgi:hypothetical protein